MKNDPQLPNQFFPLLWYFVKNRKFFIIIYSSLALAAGLWGPFNSLLIKHLIDLAAHSQGNAQALIWPASWIVLNFIIFDNFTWRGISYLRYRFLPVILYEADNTLLNYTLQHSHQFFQERMSGTLAKQIFHLLDGIGKMLETIIPNLLRATSLLLMAFIFAYQANSVFVVILMCWSVPFFGLSVYMSKKLTALSEIHAAKESILGGQITDSLTQAVSVTLFGHRKHEIDRRTPALLENQKAYQDKDRYAFLMHALQGGLIAIMMAAASFFLIRLYGQQLITLGDFALILGLCMETGHMMWFTMSQVDELNKTLGRCNQSITSIIKPIAITDTPDAQPLACTQGSITFDKVYFGYSPEKPLYQNQSLDIPTGQKVGLVGYSGGGKSTLVHLIMRLYDVNGGSILIDGQDIKSVTQESLRKSIALIPQDPSLFHRSVMENIRYGDTNQSDEAVIEAAKKAHAHEFIQQLPYGYDSLVGERGVKLSGGQRQRIAIARALLKNAPILILDEATSQLDSVTEHLIQDSLWTLMQGKTTLVVAHRLSTLLHMDRILVFETGKIVEDGTHQELLAKNGLYKQLWDAQVGGFLGDETVKII
jgi:ATP-binding cassette subfamily B protein